ncbi:MAG: CDP-alcohol phosphatidyltransferase family protein [Bradymonadaceae bacterium]
MSMGSFIKEVADVYRSSRKNQDIFWNVYVARPMAAMLVYFLRRTPATPNQITFLGVFVFFGAAAALIFWRDPWGMLVAALILQLSYLFDCADGQLARLKGMTSEVGSHLDFLMDEIKALVLVAAVGLRLWLVYDELWWLIAGMGAVILVAVATSLTTFVRRPEYAGVEIKPGASAMKKPIPTSLPGKVMWLVERVASFFVHYPSWFLYVALLDFVPGFDGAIVFFVLFLGVYLAYTARTSLAILFKLGRPGFYKS